MMADLFEIAQGAGCDADGTVALGYHVFKDRADGASIDVYMLATAYVSISVQTHLSVRTDPLARADQHPGAYPLRHIYIN